MCPEIEGIKTALNGGRRSRRHVAENYHGNSGHYTEEHEPVDDRRHRHDHGRSSDSCRCCGADRADMRIRSVGAQVRTTVQLRREKNDPEEYSQKVNLLCFAKHLAGTSLLLPRI